MPQDETSIGGSCGTFNTTPWLLLKKQDLDELLRIYWRPIYLHLRRKGAGVEEAKDLTQDFFTACIEKNYLEQVDPGRGRFRDFLRAAADHFFLNSRKYDRREKRGGGRVVPIDISCAERLLSGQPDTESSFDREWAKAILDDALEELKAEYDSRGQLDHLNKVLPFLTGGSCEDRVGLHRARKRFNLLVQMRVSRTVPSASQIEEELKTLYRAL